ncbi:NlpC/P60 family protein [Sulfurovum lithotrophicum]|uniref:NlpC/P60 family protein n=1 Tax=Sulfurovum lithotrophicum TaxID=206403 RepID=UPI0014702452|nr:NlpC/P60 family protein [Sulfurovum lithotrophicum]
MLIIILSSISLLVITACKPSPHPKHPHYEIEKPKVKYPAHKESLEKMVKELKGSPYVWAEEGPNQFDCSGYTYYMYGSMGINLPRTAREQAKVGKYIKPSELKYGDLIFFDTTKRRNGKITHVGMYLGDGWFTHASTTKNEVVYSNLRTSPYYKKRLRICRRYLPQTKQTSLAQTSKKATPWKTNDLKQLKQSTGTKVDRKAVPPRPVIDNSREKGSFYVQVGSFGGSPKSALLYKIRRLGYTYKIIKFPRNGKQISKLLIGPYKYKTTALGILPKVKQEIEPGAFIAEIL